jgi:hypothetical protein
MDGHYSDLKRMCESKSKVGGSGLHAKRGGGYEAEDTKDVRADSISSLCGLI